MRSHALVIFSGGQDSTTCLFWARKQFDSVECVTFDYGQRHSIELQCSAKICKDLNIAQKVIAMDFLTKLNSNALTDSSVKVAGDGGMHNLPSTFVPGRNILFLNLAAAYAVPRNIRNLVIGVCQTDFSGYPDCREDFISSMEVTLQLGLQEPGLKIHRPLMNLSKGQIFKLAQDSDGLEVVVRDSHTCYEGDRSQFHEWGYGCGSCPACELRLKGWQDFKKGNL